MRKKRAGAIEPVASSTGGLIGLEEIEELIETALFTAQLKVATGDKVDTKPPISVLLVARSGAGKTRTLKRYLINEAVTMRNDLTSSRLFDVLGQDKLNNPPNGKLTHFVVSDLYSTLSGHKDQTVSLFLGNLLSLLEDGVIEMDYGGDRKVKINHPPMGLLAGLTPSLYEEFSELFRKNGLFRRLLVVFWDYKTVTLTRAQGSIARGQNYDPPAIRLSLPTKPVLVTIPVEIAAKIETASKTFVETTSWVPGRRRDGHWKWYYMPEQLDEGERTLPMAPHHTLRTLAAGHALRRHSKVVEQVDVDFITRMNKYLKYGKAHEV